MSASRTLLYLARDFPVPVSSAARLRTYNWIVHLSRHFAITFVAAVKEPPDPAYLDAVRPYCTRVLVLELRGQRRRLGRLAERLAAEACHLTSGLPPEAWYLLHGPAGEVVGRLRRAERFDVVFAERWSWGREALSAAPLSVLDAGAPLVERAPAALRDSRNPLRRMLHRRLERRYAQHEARAVARADLVLTEGPAERQALRALGRDGDALVLPSGLCTRYFAPRRSAVDPVNVVFFGALANLAQRDALLHLHRDLMPAVRQHVPSAHLTVVGENPTPELRSDQRQAGWLQFTGPVEDERLELWRGAVAALPLRFGSGSRSRLAQLLAMGIPVVATPAAARGLGLRSGEGLLVAPDGPDFSLALAQVLADPSLREDLSRRGRAVAEARLSLDATYRRLSTLLAHGLSPA